MFLVNLVAGVVASFLLFGPAVYAGLDVLPGEEPVEYPVAATTAIVAVALAGLVDALLGWLPAIGVLLSPLVWVVVVQRFTDASWPAGAAVGIANWALSVLLYAGLRGMGGA